MLRQSIAAAAALLLLSGAAMADAIEGRWTTDAGSTAEIAGCGGAFCITLRSGAHSGKRIGRMSATGNNKYSGDITDPATDKTYSGDATLSGNSLKMRGCVALVLCRSQNWKRQ